MSQATALIRQLVIIGSQANSRQSLASAAGNDSLVFIPESENGDVFVVTMIAAVDDAADTARTGLEDMLIKIADYVLIDRQDSAAVKPGYTTDQIIIQLTTSWGGGDTSTHLWAASTATPGTPKADISFGINTGNPTNFTALSPEGSGLVAMTALQVATAQLSFRVWDDLIPSSLVESGGAGANITLNYSSATTGNGTYTSSVAYNTTPRDIAAEQIWLSSSWASNADSGMVNGGYGLTTLIHEIGHSLGLSHPGVYDASSGTATTYAANAAFAQDNRQYTVMSYFGGYETTANAWAQDGTSNSYKYSQTPMVYDIAAIQSLYGMDTVTRTGDTVYGYNNNFAAGDPEKSIFDFSTNSVPILTIWDAGGSDELDCSGWSGNQAINLTPGSYSSVCGLNNNVGIAFNATIEEAIGGMGNDILVGNSSNNVLNGGGGNDTIDGGVGTDTAICGGWSTCIISGNSVSAIITDLTGINGTDTLSNIENLTFNNVTVTTEAAVNDAPVGVPDTNAGDPVVKAGADVAGDSIATGNVLANDTDADSALGLGETKTVQKVNDQAGEVGVAVAGLYGSLILSANGDYTYTLDTAKAATHALTAGQVAVDAFTYTDVDAHGATGASTTLTVSITVSNDAPSLTAFGSAVAEGNEDSEVTVSFDLLQAQGNAADVDGTVTAFVIKALSSGSLKIGASAETATAWDAATNNTADAAHNAYWTPDANANGILNAFTVAAKDNGGLESAAAVQSTVAVAAVNDAPIFTATPKAINYTDTIFDDNFAIATGSLVADDIDGNTLTYGITGGTDNSNGTISKSSLYGVLTVSKASGAYAFAADDAAIEALKAGASAGFTLTTSDGSLSDSVRLTVNIAQNGKTESNGNDRLTGTPGNDSFVGLAGNDTINGSAGADTMNGGLGNDVYAVDNIGDIVIEASTLATEIDKVNSSISYTLKANVENLTLTDTTAINGTGNALNNLLVGNSGANVLNGGAGDDTLIGGAGKDVLTGGTGADIFKFNAVAESGITDTSRDTINAFKAGQGDKIDLSAIDANTAIAGNNTFSAPTVGGVFSGVFAKPGELFFDKTAHILYANNDADSAADFSISISGVSTLSATDFVL